MNCDRCEDIHQAQKSGKNKNVCSCNCHGGNITENITGHYTVNGGSVSTRCDCMVS